MLGRSLNATQNRKSRAELLLLNCLCRHNKMQLSIMLCLHRQFDNKNPTQIYRFGVAIELLYPTLCAKKKHSPSLCVHFNTYLSNYFIVILDINNCRLLCTHTINFIVISYLKYIPTWTTDEVIEKSYIKTYTLIKCSVNIRCQRKEMKLMNEWKW